MSGPPDYERVLAMARALTPEERRRLVADLVAGLELAATHPPRGAAPVGEPATPAPATAGGTARTELFAGTLDFSSGAGGERIVSNGLIVATGEPVAVADAGGMGRRADGEKIALDARKELYEARADNARPILRMVYGKDHGDLREAGWAVVVPAAASARLIEALMPLIEHRCRQQGLTLPALSFDPAGQESCAAWLERVAPREPAAPSPWHPKRAQRVPVLLYDPPSSADEWLQRNGASLAAGVVDPGLGVPYYLLFAGRPGPLPQIADDRAYIPFQVQYDVDLYWGVGRLCFTGADGVDDYEAYTAYAKHVAAFEGRQEPPYAKRIVYFATDHDYPTRMSREGLVEPLAAHPMAREYAFSAQKLVGKDATRAALQEVLRDAPPLLFTATHGADLRPHTSEKLTRKQGALICNDLGGGAADEGNWLDADSVPADARVEGMIAVLFACFGAGCPRDDTYDVFNGVEQRQIAPFDLVAALPQRLLARGALAVIGHVDIAWSHGYGDPKRPQIQGFEDILRHLMDGQRAGFATDAFNTRQAALGSQMSKALHAFRFLRGRTPPDFAGTWLAYHDARAYTLLGDPAVRLPFGDGAPAGAG